MNGFLSTAALVQASAIVARLALGSSKSTFRSSGIASGTPASGSIQGDKAFRSARLFSSSGTALLGPGGEALTNKMRGFALQLVPRCGFRSRIRRVSSMSHSARPSKFRPPGSRASSRGKAANSLAVITRSICSGGCKGPIFA